MGNAMKERTTEQLEQILKDHMTGVKECSGDEILAACEALAERMIPGTDAAGVYRHYLEVFLPGEIKKPSEF